MVVLPIPPMPHIPIMRASDDLMHQSVLSRSMRESIPTRPLESPNDVWFQFFQNELHNLTYKFGLRPTKYKEQA